MTLGANSAETISLSQVLERLDGDFAPLSRGIAEGRYVFWLGSGISRERVDDLKRVIKRALSHLRDRIDVSSDVCPFRKALGEAITFAELSAEESKSLDFDQPVDDWPNIDIILNRLTSKYTRLLDIRLDGKPPDYMLWEAVDVCNTFGATETEPDCEHLCIGILAMEGVVPHIASANWDGLIEIAVGQLTDGAKGALRVCVHSEDLRKRALRACLLKFHGCAVRAKADPPTFRQSLVATYSQITGWRHNAAHAQMRSELVNLAATKRTLMIGLSAQDTNFQDIYAEAEANMQWSWPCDPPAHVFAENTLGTDQRNLLRCVYPQAYGSNTAEIESGALLRAFAKPLLVSLVLHVLSTKLQCPARKELSDSRAL